MRLVVWYAKRHTHMLGSIAYKAYKAWRICTPSCLLCAHSRSLSDCLPSSFPPTLKGRRVTSQQRHSYLV